MFKWVVMVLVVASLGVVDMRAQSRGGTTESQLGFFIGKWSAEGQSRPKPSDALARLSGDRTCAWFSGGPSVVCRETTQDAAGETDSIAILAYDQAKKSYSIYGTDNTGAIRSGTGTLENGVWHFTLELRAAGVSTPMRYMIREAPGGGYVVDSEASAKGAWTRIGTVTYKRAR